MGGGLQSDSDSGMFVLRLASFHNDLHDDDDDADDDDDNSSRTTKLSTVGSLDCALSKPLS